MAKEKIYKIEMFHVLGKLFQSSFKKKRDLKYVKNFII